MEEIINLVRNAADECGADFVFRVLYKPAHSYTVQFAKHTTTPVSVLKRHPHTARIVGSIVISYSDYSYMEFYDSYNYFRSVSLF